MIDLSCQWRRGGTHQPKFLGLLVCFGVHGIGEAFPKNEDTQRFGEQVGRRSMEGAASHRTC